jgi:RNA polymerase sigma-70 factor (ECF subfamily)
MTRYAVYKALAKEKKAKTIEANLSKKGSGASNTEEEYDQKNMLDIVKKLTNLLPQKCRMVFIQNKLLDLPLDEVAKQMNISTKTAEAHLTKALKIVRDKMKDTLTLLTIL